VPRKKHCGDAETSDVGFEEGARDVPFVNVPYSPPL